jgi:hypothetical protein
MIIYIASESGMPRDQTESREDFIYRRGPGGRLVSYYHITTKGFSSKVSFNYLIDRMEDEDEKGREGLD